MKPRKSFFAVIAEVLHTQHRQRLLGFGIPVVVVVVLVPDFPKKTKARRLSK